MPKGLGPLTPIWHTAGLFWWQQGKGDTVLSAQNTNGLLFFEMLFLAFRAMFVALFTFPRSASPHLIISACLKTVPHGAWGVCAGTNAPLG